MTTAPIIDEAEILVRELATELTAVRAGECLCCYVARQLNDYPCNNTHRHALRYRDSCAPRATALRDRLSSVGACCCDCELFMNGYSLRLRMASAERDDDDDDDDDDDEPSFDQLPPCAGVRRGSIRPCTNWIRVRRYR